VAEDKLMSGALSEKEMSGGVVHTLPADLKNALSSDAKALETWEDITPLARNEWICWIESAKKAKTRTRRIEWGCSSLKGGFRPRYCLLLVRHERSHSSSLAFIQPVARDAPKWVFISTRISELAFLLCLVIVFSDAKDGDVLDQREIYVHPLHRSPPRAVYSIYRHSL
jgi:hypothetical protein